MLEYSMSVKILTEHHLEFLPLIEGCTGLSESTLVKMPHCWKSHVKAQSSLIRLYHNYTLQTNEQHCEEEPQNNNNHKTAGGQSKATSSLFLIRMNAKPERTQRIAYEP